MSHYKELLKDLPLESKLRFIDKYLVKYKKKYEKYEHSRYKYDFIYRGNKMNELMRNIEKLEQYKESLDDDNRDR